MDGIGWFTYHTLKNITRNHPEVEFHFLFDSGINSDFLFANNIVPHNLFPPAKHAFLNVIWFEWSARQLLKKLDPDLFFSPDGLICLSWKGKQHTVLHDINFEHRPSDLKFTNRAYYKYFIPRCAEKACHLATVSEYSKSDIVNTYGIQAEKIDVIYLGISENFSRPVSETVCKRVKEKYAGGSDYFFALGTIQPRKNISRLMQAFDLFIKETKSNLKLLIAGKELYRTAELHRLKAQLKCGENIIFTGRLAEAELPIILSSSICLVFVPVFEGFGLPAIEAMQCKVPVIASNVTSIPEIVGDAALLVDPYSIEEIKNAMERIYFQPALRTILIEKGGARKQNFNWELTSQNLWNSIQKCF